MPASPLTLHILLALALRDNNAAGILEQVAADSQSTVIVREASFYKAVARLKRDRLIAEVEDRRYTITPAGQLILRSEKVRIGRASTLLHQRT